MGVEANKEVTISYDDIKQRVKRQMAVVGKRIADTQGHTMFAGVTLSSAEESVLKQYIKDATWQFAGSLAPLVSGKVGSDNGITFLLEKTRLNDDKVSLFEENYKSYVAAYAAYNILIMSRADLAKKYAEDMANYVMAATQLIFTKDPPASSGKTLKDMTGEVILD